MYGSICVANDAKPPVEKAALPTWSLTGPCNNAYNNLQVSYSVFSAMAYSIKLTPIACDFLGTTASGVALTGQLWRVLAKGSSAVLQVGSWMGPWLLLMVEDLEKLPSGVSACYASTSIMRVLLAFALPTLAVYVMERASRRHFLQQSKVGIEVQAPMMSAIHRVAAAYVLLTSCFALWELSILVQELKTAV